MPPAVGVLLAIAVTIFAAVVRLDRDRAYYPIVVVVTASYYDLFAVMSGSMPALGMEALTTAAFICAAVVGFRANLWIVVAALAGHGVLDLVHQRISGADGAPSWWPPFCLSFDWTAAALMAWRLRTTSGKAALIPVTPGTLT